MGMKQSLTRHEIYENRLRDLSAYPEFSASTNKRRPLRVPDGPFCKVTFVSDDYGQTVPEEWVIRMSRAELDAHNIRVMQDTPKVNENPMSLKRRFDAIGFSSGPVHKRQKLYSVPGAE